MKKQFDLFAQLNELRSHKTNWRDEGISNRIRRGTTRRPAVGERAISSSNLNCLLSQGLSQFVNCQLSQQFLLLLGVEFN